MTAKNNAQCKKIKLSHQRSSHQMLCGRKSNDSSRVCGCVLKWQMVAVPAEAPESQVIPSFCCQHPPNYTSNRFKLTTFTHGAHVPGEWRQRMGGLERWETLGDEHENNILPFWWRYKIQNMAKIVHFCSTVPRVNNWSFLTNNTTRCQTRWTQTHNHNRKRNRKSFLHTLKELIHPTVWIGGFGQRPSTVTAYFI